MMKDLSPKRRAEALIDLELSFLLMTGMRPQVINTVRAVEQMQLRGMAADRYLRPRRKLHNHLQWKRHPRIYKGE